MILLGRTPNAEEIALLVSSYVEDTGTRTTAIEELLVHFAEKYLPKHLADEQIGRIKKFVHDWENTFD